MEFKKGDHVFLKVSSTTRIRRSIKQTKLNPRFVGPFEVLDKVGKLAYRIALPPHLSRLHDVFHVSQLKKYQPDPEHVLEYESLEVQENLTFKVIPEGIIDRQQKNLHNKNIPFVKVV